MSDSTHLLAVSATNSRSIEIASPITLGIKEDQIEEWIIDNPRSLGDSIMIVCSQYKTWASESGESALERLDILGLDSSGVPVVVELKRDQDRTVHIQAITYAALVASFTKKTMAEAHAKFLNARNENAVTTEAALELLESHVDENWDEALLATPRIILIAAQFPAQVYTAVTWLTEVSNSSGLGGLSIELRTVSAFRSDPNDEAIYLIFQRIFPEESLEVRRLVAGAVANRVAEASDKLAERKRNARSTHIIFDHNLINIGDTLELDLASIVRPEIIEQVNNWVRDNPHRGKAEWTDNRSRPLRWRADQSDYWAPTKLARYIIEEATGDSAPNFSGPDAWTYNGESLYRLAYRTVSQE